MEFKKENVVTNMDGEALRIYENLREIEQEEVQYTVQEEYYNYLRKWSKRLLRKVLELKIR